MIQWFIATTFIVWVGSLVAGIAGYFLPAIRLYAYSTLLATSILILIYVSIAALASVIQRR